jgi:hypothetical protein
MPNRDHSRVHVAAVVLFFAGVITSIASHDVLPLIAMMAGIGLGVAIIRRWPDL